MSEQYDIRRLMCDTEVGQIAFGRFVEHADCAAASPRTGGLLRCCRGTLDFALMGGYLSVVADDGMLDRMIAEGAGPRPSSRRRGRRAGRRAPGPRPAHTTGQTGPPGLRSFPRESASGPLLEPGEGEPDQQGVTG